MVHVSWVFGKTAMSLAGSRALSPKRRRQIAVEAAQTQWAAEQERWIPVKSPSAAELFAKLPGVLDLGGSQLDVYILSNGDRVMSRDEVVQAISNNAGNLEEHLGIFVLK